MAGTEKPAAKQTAPDAKSDPRNPDTVADRDPTAPTTYGVGDTDPTLQRTFGFHSPDVPADLHDPKPGEGPVEPRRMPSVVGLGDTMRERSANRKKLDTDDERVQTTTVDGQQISTK